MPHTEELTPIRHNWTKEEVETICHKPLLDLVFEGGPIHRQFHTGSEVQVCTLLSVKTGGCHEDCAYCPQATRYHTGVQAHKLLGEEVVVDAACQQALFYTDDWEAYKRFIPAERHRVSEKKKDTNHVEYFA
ncbi:hypothetical protein BH24BAC1_BH24BAC1_12280 [soil metagenome]